LRREYKVKMLFPCRNREAFPCHAGCRKISSIAHPLGHRGGQGDTARGTPAAGLRLSF